MTPPSSAKPLEAALAQNPHLTSLPHPKASVVAPEDLTDTTGTAELLRLPEVQNLITGDFLVLPCDLVCELPGESLLDAWMVQNDPLGSVVPPTTESRQGLPGKPRSCGVGVWFETKGSDAVKDAETDFIITASGKRSIATPAKNSLRPHLSKLLYASTTDTLRDKMQEKSGLLLRGGMIRRHGRLTMRTTHRASHVYIFPRWMLDVIKNNEKFDSISEDIIGWWAKAGWQEGLADKLEMLPPSDVIYKHHHTHSGRSSVENFSHLITTRSMSTDTSNDVKRSSFPPPILAYTHPYPSPYMIRRVDTSALLLSTSLHLAKLPPSRDAVMGSSPTALSHPTKISTDPSLIANHTTIDTSTTLIGPNTSVATHCTVKTSCIGANCTINEGAKILDSLLMDGVRIEAKAALRNCILGRRCIIGRGATLDGCEIQEGFVVEDGTIGTKGQKFSVFEGLENGLENLGEMGENSTDLTNNGITA